MKINHLRNFALGGIATAVMLGCGGSGDSGATASSGSTGITTVGVITGFGSVFVNGVEYETRSTEYEVEDESAFDDSALRIGMVVKVKGSVNPDGLTGTADQIIYEDELEGPVQGLTSDTNLKHFTLFGVPITVSSTDTYFDTQYDAGFGFDTLANNDHVEVSGYFNGQALQATYIKKEDLSNNDFDVKGEITAINGDTYTLTTFFNANITFTLAAGAMIPPNGIQIGQYVEVEGTLSGPDSLSAFKVELEDRHHLSDDEGEIEIRGLLTDDSGNLFLNGMPVTLSSDIEYEPPELENTINNLPLEGLMVKIHGDYRNGMLVIDKIEDKQESLEFKGEVAGVTATGAKTGTLSISFGNATGTVTVNLDSNTMYPDDNSLQQFDLRNDVRIGDYVEVKAMQNQIGQVFATLLDVDDSIGEFEVEGPLDTFSDGSSITAMNVTFSVDSGTVYLPRKPVSGDNVDITDLDRDGIADQVEIED